MELSDNYQIIYSYKFQTMIYANQISHQYWQKYIDILIIVFGVVIIKVQ